MVGKHLVWGTLQKDEIGIKFIATLSKFKCLPLKHMLKDSYYQYVHNNIKTIVIY